MKTSSKLNVLALSAFVLALSGVAAAADSTTTGGTTTTTTGGTTANSDHGKPDHSASRVQNGRNAIQGNLQTSQHIYYVGDALNISVQFARGADLLASGAADAHIVIFSQDGAVSSVPVPPNVGTNARKFFAIPSIDTKTLPAGQYQLALVLTVPKGNPTIVNDWYSGFRALLDTEAVLITDVAVPGDANKDGEWDDDSDGDGIAGNEVDAAELHAKKK